MSTAPVLDDRLHASALRATVDARLGEHRAYDYDGVPGSPLAATEALRNQPLPDLYALVTVERRPVFTLRSTAQAGRSSWRVTVGCVGRTVNESRWVMARTYEALDQARVSVGGQTTSPLQFEVADAPEHNDGRFYGRVAYTYTA